MRTQPSHPAFSHFISLLVLIMIIQASIVTPAYQKSLIDDNDVGIPSAGTHPMSSATITKFVLPFYGTTTVTQTGGEKYPGDSHGCPHRDARYKHYNCAALGFGLAGGTSVHAIYKGTVVFAGNANDGFGNRVVVEHDGLGMYSLYAHLSKIETRIQQGVRVEQLTKLGEVGHTGGDFPDHLHFGVTLMHGDGDIFMRL